MFAPKGSQPALLKPVRGKQNALTKSSPAPKGKQNVSTKSTVAVSKDTDAGANSNSASIEVIEVAVEAEPRAPMPVVTPEPRGAAAKTGMSKSEPPKSGAGPGFLKTCNIFQDKEIRQMQGKIWELEAEIKSKEA